MNIGISLCQRCGKFFIQSPFQCFALVVVSSMGCRVAYLNIQGLLDGTNPLDIPVSSIVTDNASERLARLQVFVLTVQSALARARAEVSLLMPFGELTTSPRRNIENNVSGRLSRPFSLRLNSSAWFSADKGRSFVVNAI